MKPLAPDDPHELVGVALPAGEGDDMAECVIEEYLMLGWSEQQIMLLFTRPCFRMTHRVYLDRGREGIAALIARVRARWTANEMDGCHA